MIRLSALLLATSFLISPAYAHEETGDTMTGMQMSAKPMQEAAKSANTLKLSVVNPQPLEAGKEAKVQLLLNRVSDGKALSFDDLKEAHTQKLHVLVIDSTLSDYHHVHPIPAKDGSGYVFNFTPKKSGDYRMWADVVPTDTGTQEYDVADMKDATPSAGEIDKTTNQTVTVDGLTFKLAFDGEPKKGEAAMGNVTITKDGKPFTQLEPVMAAFAHIVGFSEDRKTVVHIHPMGIEPTKESDRDGPTLQFHIEPNKAGFTKMFVQVRVNGKDVFAPFGVMVK